MSEEECKNQVSMCDHLRGITHNYNLVVSKLSRLKLLSSSVLVSHLMQCRFLISSFSAPVVHRFLYVESLSVAYGTLSRPCFAVPPAESPSTRKISHNSGSFSEQSASFPGNPDPLITVFL